MTNAKVSVGNPKTIVDCLGQTISTSNVVLPTNGSTFYTTPLVVTRLGSTDRIQLDGSSYGEAKLMIKVNEQYIYAKGQQAFDELVAAQKHKIDTTPVPKAKVTPKYVIIGQSDYASARGSGNPHNEVKDTNVVFSVVCIKDGTVGSMYDSVRPVCDDVHKNQCYSYKPSADSKYDILVKPHRFNYSYDTNSMIGIKKIRELNLEQYIGGTIPPYSAEYHVLLELYLKAAS